jgi:hypothetical protein
MDVWHQNFNHLSIQLPKMLHPHSRMSTLHDQLNSIQYPQIAKNYSSSNIPSVLQPI